MKILLILLVWSCAVISNGPAEKDKSIESKKVKSPQGTVFFVLNQENFVNGKKGESDFNYPYFLEQIQKELPGLAIESSLEKAEYVLEVQTETRKSFNRIIPVLSILTFTLVPFYQEIESKELFRVLNKNGEVVFQSSRKETLDYWFGFFFIIKGMMQFAKPENINRSGFEDELLLKMNKEIIQEWKREN